MKSKQLLVIVGIILYIGGNVINLLFSSNLLWGEMEARLFTPQTGSRSLDITCPLVIAPWEEATIQTVITNTELKETKPQVNAFVSQAIDSRVETQTLILEPSESKALQWTVGDSDIVFDRLILVSILQRPYRKLESHQGSCSIFVYSLFGLNGQSTLITVIEIGVLSSLIGIGLLYYSLHPFSELVKKIIGVNTIFIILVLLGLLSALPRLWGLTLFFNSTALLAISVAYVEILLSRK